MNHMLSNAKKEIQFLNQNKTVSYFFAEDCIKMIKYVVIPPMI